MHSQVPHSNTQGTTEVQRLRLTLLMAEHVQRIGARIRARREELDLSRRKLAGKMAGVVTENDIYRWERGQHKPGDDKLEALAIALEVDVSYFMLPEPEPGTPDLMAAFDNGESQLDRMEAKLDAILVLLDDDGDELASGGAADLGGPPSGGQSGGGTGKQSDGRKAVAKPRAPKRRPAA